METRTFGKVELNIDYCEFVENPRTFYDGNVGKFIFISEKFQSPDNDNELIEIINETLQEANNQEDHIKLIKKELSSKDDKVNYIVPIYQEDHTNVYYRLGTKYNMDCSNSGFYIVMKSDLKRLGLPFNVRKEKLEKMIREELEIYNSYCNGEVYQFTLKDDEGKELIHNMPYYNLDSLRFDLPKEFENENLLDYLNR